MAVTRTPTKPPVLRRELGGWTTTAMVVGNMIGSGVFLLPAALAVVALEYGSGSLLAWIVTGVGAMLLAAVFASLGRAYPRTGGPYVYARRAFGDFMGFQTAWGYWIAAWVGNAAIATAFVGALAVFIPILGDGTTEGHLWAYATAIGTIWLLTLINAWGVRQTGAVQLVTTILKFVPLVLIGIIGLFFMDTGNFGDFAPNGYGTGTGLIGGITAAMALTLWAFIGLESATVPAEEVRDPARTIPRATIRGTLVTAVLYAVATIAVMGIIPLTTLQDSTAPFADAATEVFGGTLWGKVVALVVMVSTFGALNGWILLQGRVPYAAARDGLFPRAFGKLGRTGTPVFGLVVSSILITGLMALNYHKDLVDNFTFVILLATLVTLVPYAFSAAAEAYLMITDRTAFVGRRFVRDIAVAALAFAYTVWTMIGSGMETSARASCSGCSASPSSSGCVGRSGTSTRRSCPTSTRWWSPSTARRRSACDRSAGGRSHRAGPPPPGRERRRTMGRPVTHFEIGVRDLGKAAEFYEELFGWDVDEERTPGYRLVQTAQDSVGGGFLKVPEGVPPYVTIYVGVTELRSTLERAEELGAKVTVQPMPIPGVGEFAMFQDPDGAMVGVFEERAA